MASSTDRNAEIWSTRLQRELLALTTEDEAHQAPLPPFLKVKTHQLVIENGVCRIAFVVDIKEEATPEIVVMLDASLPRNADGSLSSIAAYPFQKPRAILSSGAERFPPGSTVNDGDVIDIDCDWTPSLHLSDAALNVALKIRECISQGEKFHASQQENEDWIDPVEEALRGAKKIGSFFSKSFKGAKVQMPNIMTPNQKSRDRASAGGAAAAAAPAVSSPAAASPPPTKTQPRSDGNVQAGDVIDLSESPWAECPGMYSCKAIRRPKFVDEIMAQVDARSESSQVAGAGFSGAGSMFRSFVGSARSIMEESYLMITTKHVIELRSNKLNFSSATVTFAVPISMLAKLKFRREESISLFFKQAPEDPLIYMCLDSADAVQQIQRVLKQHGVKGKHTNAHTQRAIQAALFLVGDIKTLESELEKSPSVDRVDEIMDLYRQAAEKFEVAGDPRHEEVVSHMRNFLKKPLVVSILDGSFEEARRRNEPKPTIVEVPQGEVLEAHSAHLSAHDDEDQKGSGIGSKASQSPSSKEKAAKSDEEFDQNINDILKEAKQDFEDMGLGATGDDDEENDDDVKEVLANPDSSGEDPIADLDAMLSAADKELADIMKL